MPPAKYDALVRAWRRRERRKNERAALVAVSVRNANGGKGNGVGFKISDLIGEDEDDE